MKKASITFCGGAGEVTGANFLLDTGETKVLVDCGSLERERVCDDANFTPFSYDPKSISALFLTHAHADHIGRVPKLVREGFSGEIYSTPATRDLAVLMFDDALRVMQDEKERHGCDVLYEKADADRALSLWRTHGYHEPFRVGGISVELIDAGHILGSAMVRLTREGRTILFTGDIGNSPEPLLPDPESPEGVNYVVMESVYGDRVHEGRDGRREALLGAIESARSKKGVLLIPSFSIERTQLILFEIDTLLEAGVLQPIPVYLDAPLATEVTGVFRKYEKLFNAEARARVSQGDDLFSFKNLKVIDTTRESHLIHQSQNPKVIIAGAGMSSGGRIRFHEKLYLEQSNATILFVGYQAPGSLGRRIQDGEKKVVIDGDRIRVRAEIRTLEGYSGHADREQLLDFVEHVGDSLERAFVVMGEMRSSLYLAQRIRDFLGKDAVVPEKNQKVEIDW